MDTKELLNRIKEDNVKFISLQFTDVTGSVKSVDMPVRNFPDALEDGGLGGGVGEDVVGAGVLPFQALE